MSVYASSAEVEKRGRCIHLRESFAEMKAQLRANERAATVTSTTQGKVSFVIMNQGDYDAVKRDHPANLRGLYAIGPDVYMQKY